MHKGKVRLYYAMFISSILIFMSVSVLIMTNYVENEVILSKFLASIILVMVIPLIRARYYKLLLDEMFLYQNSTKATINKIYRLEMVSIIFVVIMLIQTQMMSDMTSIYLNITMMLIVIRSIYFVVAMGMKSETMEYEILKDDS